MLRSLRRWERGEERPGALLARRTRTIGMCSFDARSKGQPWPLLYVVNGVKRGLGLSSSCARATRGRGLPSLGLMARLGVPVGGGVRKLREVEDPSASIPEYFINVAHGTDSVRRPLYGSCLSRVGIGSLSGGVNPLVICGMPRDYWRPAVLGYVGGRYKRWAPSSFPRFRSKVPSGR